MRLKEIQKKYVLIIAGLLAILLILIGSSYAYLKFFKNNTVVSTLPATPATPETTVVPVTPVPGADSNPRPQTIPNSSEPSRTIWTAVIEGCQKDPEADFKSEQASIPDHVLNAGFLALAKKDIAVCASTGSTKDSNGSTCEDKYVLLTTLSTVGSDCGKIANRDLSISCSANQKKDSAVCSQISDAGRKTVCEAVVSGDAGKCDALPADQKGSCSNTVVFVKALNSHDVNVCGQIDASIAGGIFDRTYCKIVLSQDSQKAWNEYYSNSVCVRKYAGSVAKEKNDISFCENIPGKDVENKSLYADCVAQFK